MMTNAFDGLTQRAARASHIWNMAQEQANANGAPVEIWGRDGWMVISEDPEPEGAEENGWRSVALIAPEI